MRYSNDYAPTYRQHYRLQAVNRALALSLDDWLKHRTECLQCGLEDWYDPGFPKLVTDLEDATIVVCDKEGNVVALGRATFDVRVLCPKGARLFLDWVHLAVANPPNMRRL